MRGVDYELENVNIMVPGLTKEFGTFSIFKRTNGAVQFLVVDNKQHAFVDFQQPEYQTNRNKLISTLDKSVFSFVDRFGFIDVYLPVRNTLHPDQKQPS